MTTTLTYYSRCPLELGDNHRCDHPAKLTVRSDELIPELDMMRHTICCQDDKGHTWSTSWSTDVTLT